MYIHLACLTYKQQFANIFCLCYFQINHIYVIISWLFFTYLCRVLICRKKLENKIPPIINWVVLPLPTGIYIFSKNIKNFVVGWYILSVCIVEHSGRSFSVWDFDLRIIIGSCLGRKSWPNTPSSKDFTINEFFGPLPTF